MWNTLNTTPLLVGMIYILRFYIIKVMVFQMNFWVMEIIGNWFLPLTDCPYILKFEINEMFIMIKSQKICKFEIFEYSSLNLPILCWYHIIDLKINKNPYKIFEMKKWNDTCSFSKDIILTETTKSKKEKKMCLR